MKANDLSALSIMVENEISEHSLSHNISSQLYKKTLFFQCH